MEAEARLEIYEDMQAGVEMLLEECRESGLKELLDVHGALEGAKEALEAEMEKVRRELDEQNRREDAALKREYWRSRKLAKKSQARNRA